MPSSLWRAVGFTLPDGELVVEATHSGQLVRHVVSLHAAGETRQITSLHQLTSELAASGVSAEQLARDDPAGFAFLVCILSNRPRHVFPRDAMWPELEEHFGLGPSANQPRIENGRFSFVAYSQYMPTLRVSRLTVDLKTLQVEEEELVNAPWPPAA